MSSILLQILQIKHFRFSAGGDGVLHHTVTRLEDRPRFKTALPAFFAFAGFALAVVGLYGLMEFLTTQRSHGIGIRMAVGAARR